MDKAAITRAIDRFQNLRVLIVGDVILDAYYCGRVSRISPEAPVSVLDVTSKEHRMGGAANVALNVKKLGATPLLCSVVGTDDAGRQITALMESESLPVTGIHASGERKTSVKTRFMDGSHHLLRMDEESTAPLSAQDEGAVLAFLSDIIERGKVDVVIFEDYDKGAVTPGIIAHVCLLAKAKNIPVAVDPKKRNFLHYAGVTLFKPNLRELREGLGLHDLGTTRPELENAFRALCETMPVEIALFTLSDNGAFITNGRETHHFPAHKRTIADVSGAGDTVIATAACALAAGLGIGETAYLANLAGGWVCQFPGVVAVEADALLKELMAD